VARAPGRNVVYLGCALLILGIFAMLYVRERRLWVWLAPHADGSRAAMALSSNRQTLEVDREFAGLRLKILGTP
jgi:cytochrome c biogenesis protein